MNAPISTRVRYSKDNFYIFHAILFYCIKFVSLSVTKCLISEYAV